jgi:hypothetical protein
MLTESYLSNIQRITLAAHRPPLSGLCPAPNRRNRNPLRPYPVENQIWSAAYDQLPNSWLTSHAAQVRMLFQSFDQRNDPNRQSRRRVRLVLGDVSSYPLRPRQWRPDNL